jgi:alkylation response protein AidB-like acyl-CoA dehydrogenase
MLDATSSVEELDELRVQISEFLRAEREHGSYVPRCDAWMRDFDRSFSRKLAQHGWLGISWPVAYGGAGRSHLARLVVTEELLRFGAPVAAHWMAERQIGPAILRYGTDVLKQEFLPSIAAGEVTFCLGMSETEAGSDLAAVRTMAVKDGGGYRVTGTKIWTTNAHHSEFAYVLACTNRDESKESRLTELILDMHAPGVDVRPIYDLAGDHHFNEVFFDGVFVPDRWIIGEVGRGWEQVTAQLAFERGGPERFMSTYPLLAQVVEAVGAGADDPSAAELIGGLVGRLRALRTLAREVARLADAGEAPVRPAAMLKFLGGRFEQDVLETAQWLADGINGSLAAELATTLGNVQMSMPGISLRGGSTEILAGIIARNEGRS